MPAHITHCIDAAIAAEHLEISGQCGEPGARAASSIVFPDAGLHAPHGGPDGLEEASDWSDFPIVRSFGNMFPFLCCRYPKGIHRGSANQFLTWRARSDVCARRSHAPRKCATGKCFTSSTLLLSRMPFEQ